APAAKRRSAAPPPEAHHRQSKCVPSPGTPLLWIAPIIPPTPLPVALNAADGLRLRLARAESPLASNRMGRIMSEAREFDLIVFGASGFTGRLVAEYVQERYGADGGLRWALAGRNESKLEQIRDELGIDPGVAILKADVTDADSLRALARRTRLVLTTVGPYQLYGEPLVAACAGAGTDYVDLC